MGRLKEPMFHIWEQVRATGHIHGFLRIRIHESCGLSHRHGPVVDERGQSQHITLPLLMGHLGVVRLEGER